MLSDEDRAVLKAMRLFGGHFVRSLAECFYQADAENFARLKDAFPQIWEEYQDAADVLKKSEKVVG